MKSKKKLSLNVFGKFISLIMIVTCVLITAGVMAYADGEMTDSDGHTYTVSGDTLTISGAAAFNEDCNIGGASIADYVNNNNIKKVVLADDVTVMGDDMFKGCTKLTSVTIGSGVTKLTMAVFSGCTSLESITIPGNVTKIGQNIFEYCTGLKSITFENTNPDNVQMYPYTFYGLSDHEGVFYVPEGTKTDYTAKLLDSDAYITDGGWSVKEITATTASVFTSGAIIWIAIGVAVILIGLCIFFIIRKKKIQKQQ